MQPARSRRSRELSTDYDQIPWAASRLRTAATMTHYSLGSWARLPRVVMNPQLTLALLKPQERHSQPLAQARPQVETTPSALARRTGPHQSRPIPRHAAGYDRLSRLQNLTGRSVRTILRNAARWKHIRMARAPSSSCRSVELSLWRQWVSAWASEVDWALNRCHQLRRLASRYESVLAPPSLGREMQKPRHARSRMRIAHDCRRYSTIHRRGRGARSRRIGMLERPRHRSCRILPRWYWAKE